MITETDPAGVQPSQPVAGNTKDFVTRLLPESEKRWPRARAQPSEIHPGWGLNFGLAAPVATTPTPNDLAVLYGGRTKLLTVKEVAEQLGVCAATVYRLCDSGELPHVRVVHSIRVRPADLAAFITSRAGGGSPANVEMPET